MKTRKAFFKLGQRASRPLRFAVVVTAICAVTGAAYADTTIANNVTLTADADWRADGVVTVPQGVTVDLNGHTLWVSGLAGAGTFTSSVADPSTFDLTTTDASKVSSPTVFVYNDISAANLFNNNYDRGEAGASDANSRRIIVANENLPVIVDYDFGAATHVNSYRVYAGGYRGDANNQNSGHQRTAKHWKFYGSNDEGNDKSWTFLDERTVTDWNDKTAPDCRQFTFFNATDYRYYRMEILEPQDSSNGYLELVQLEYGCIQNQVRLVPSQVDGFAAASNTVSGTAKFVIGCGALTDHDDLRGLGKVTLAANETLDLAGSYLKVHAIDGTGRLASSDTTAFVDLTTPAAAKTCATSTSNGSVLVMAGDDKYPASAAFDNDIRKITTNPGSFVYYAGFPAAGIEINYDFGVATYINHYRIMGSNDGEYTSVPKSWAFEGSNDGTTWTTLDERTNQTLVQGVWSEYTFLSEASFNIYRMRFTAVTGSKFYLFELEYGAVPYNVIYVDAAGLASSDCSGITTADGASLVLADGDSVVLSDDIDISGLAVNGTIDLRGHTLTVDRLEGIGTITDTRASSDLTDTDATRVWSPNTYYSSNAGTAKNAFSNPFVTTTPSSTKTRVMAVESQLPVVIDYDFRTATLVDSYRLTAGDNVNRAPGAWELFGSNDDTAYGAGELSAWTRLDTHFGETWSAVFETRDFCFANATPYRYYRMRFTKCATQGNGYFTFWKLQYCNTADRGHLRVVVPDGPVVYNRTVSLTGNLRLVKEGDGIFVAMRQRQTYNGGTDVVAGRLTLGAQGDTMPLGARDGDITVRKNTLVDLNGNSAFHNYGFSLDGGTLKYRGDDVNSASMITRMRLTDDSTFNLEKNFGFYGATANNPTFVDLGGHTLEIQIAAGKYFRNYNTTYVNGAVEVTSGTGWFLAGGSYVTALDVDFKILSALHIASTFSVRGYEANYYSTTLNKLDVQMTVAGVFKPTVAAYYGCTMQAGSTMDLTAWPKAAGWPMVSAFTQGKTNLEFADSGEIAVNLAGRDDLKALARSADPHLFTWTVVDDVPVVPGADFVLDPDTAAAGFRVRKDATGLRLIYYTKGMMLIVK